MRYITAKEDIMDRCESCYWYSNYRNQFLCNYLDAYFTGVDPKEMCCSEWADPEDMAGYEEE